jgi:hypothetical protein
MIVRTSILATRRPIMIHHRPQGFDHDFFRRSCLVSGAAVGGSMLSSVSVPVSEGKSEGTVHADSDEGRAEDASGGKPARLKG